jgi:hypothetical protein
MTWLAEKLSSFVNVVDKAVMLIGVHNLMPKYFVCGVYLHFLCSIKFNDL